MSFLFWKFNCFKFLQQNLVQTNQPVSFQLPNLHYIHLWWDFLKMENKNMLGVICHCVKIVRILIFSGPYFPAFSPNAGKHGLEKLGIRTLFTQRVKNIILRSKWTFLITSDPLDIFKNDWKYRNWFVARRIRLLFFFSSFFFFWYVCMLDMQLAEI